MVNQERYFVWNTARRAGYIESKILPHVPKSHRAAYEREISLLAEQYEARDADLLLLLGVAARNRNLDNCIEYTKRVYHESLRHVPPQNRNNRGAHGLVCTLTDLAKYWDGLGLNAAQVKRTYSREEVVPHENLLEKISSK